MRSILGLSALLLMSCSLVSETMAKETVLMRCVNCIRSKKNWNLINSNCVSSEGLGIVTTF